MQVRKKGKQHLPCSASPPLEIIQVPHKLCKSLVVCVNPGSVLILLICKCMLLLLLTDKKPTESAQSLPSALTPQVFMCHPEEATFQRKKNALHDGDEFLSVK